MAGQRSRRNAQLVRLLSIVRDLSRRDGVDVYELAANHGTTVRTIWRDLAALGEAGLPLVEAGTGRRSRWRLASPDPRRHAARTLTLSHYAALRAALAMGAGTALTGPLGAIADQLEAGLSDTDRRRLASLADCLGVSGRDALDEAAPDVVVPLLLAASERRRCRIVYRPPGSTSHPLDVLPLRLFGRAGASYLLVHHPQRGVLTLALRRIAKLTVLTERAAPPTGFDPRRHIDSLFDVHGTGELVRYRLRFAAEVAPYIRERRWHPTQTLRNHRDGTVTLSFLCQQSFEVSAWVASWRQHVSALAPWSLRRELDDLGRVMTARYSATQ